MCACGAARRRVEIFLNICIGMCLCLFFTSYNTNFKNKLKCNQIIDCTNFLNLQNRPNFHSEERLISLVRRGECVVGLSILLVYGLGAPRLPAVCGGRTPGQDQEAGQEVEVFPPWTATK